jgi:hypothetical protein
MQLFDPVQRAHIVHGYKPIDTICPIQFTLKISPLSNSFDFGDHQTYLQNIRQRL